MTAVEDPPAPEVTEVTVVSATAGGGEVADRVTVLADDEAVTAYAEQFRGGMVGKLTSAAERIEVPDGHVLVAAVVAVGCDIPHDVEVTGTGADAEFVLEKDMSPIPECFAAVTSVALAAVPA